MIKYPPFPLHSLGVVGIMLIRTLVLSITLGMHEMNDHMTNIIGTNSNCDWHWENPPVTHKDNYLERRS